MSPSRERFLKEHSASPFSLDENSEKQKRKKSNRGSWFKNFASPLFGGLVGSTTRPHGSAPSKIYVLLINNIKITESFLYKIKICFIHF
jgi:hypothetical protein